MQSGNNTKRIRINCVQGAVRQCRGVVLRLSRGRLREIAVFHIQAADSLSVSINLAFLLESSNPFREAEALEKVEKIMVRI